MHAAVDLEPHAQGARGRFGLKPGQLRFVMNHRIKLEATHLGQIGGFVGATQDDDALALSGRAQALPVGDCGDAEGICPVA